MSSRRKATTAAAPILRSAAEAALARAPAPEAPPRNAVELLHDLQVHQVELEMQNEALRQAQCALEASRDRYVDLYEFAPIGYLTLSAAGVISAINLTGASLLGAARRTLLGKRFSRYVESSDQERWQRHFLHALQCVDKQSHELTIVAADARNYPACLDCMRTSGDDGASNLRVTLADISERRAVEEERRIAAIAFESQEGMLVTDPAGVILRVNQAFTRLTGYSNIEAIGRTPALLHSGHHDEAFFRLMWKTLIDSGLWQGEIWNRRKSGEIYVGRMMISAVYASREHRVSHYVGAFSDITQTLAAEAEIHQLAYFDPLTRLPNRRLLQDRMRLALIASDRSGHYGALLYLDLDSFKNLNDTHGHDVGDQMLMETARRIQAQVRQADCVSRQGGDEFLVMLLDLSEDAEAAALKAREVGEKIRRTLAIPYDLDGREFHSSASLGVALFRGHHETVETLLRHADLAMYKAKRTGGNLLQFFDPAMQEVLDQRSALESDLRLALERAQLCLYYQPQLDTGGRVTGAEALLRWAHHTRGLVLPNEFIPLAEETGLILPIGAWVLANACEQIKLWSTQAGLSALCIAVNISARQFRQPDFVAQVAGILQSTGADARNLVLELTESQAVDSVDETVAHMRALRALGVGFSMDDFGTGFSSLSYLKRLPLDQLKIDAAFVRDVAHSPDDAAIVQTIIAMGKTLGLEVIAEGVETLAQEALLRGFGWLMFQGYRYAQPLALADFEAFVGANLRPAQDEAAST